MPPLNEENDYGEMHDGVNTTRLCTAMIDARRQLEFFRIHRTNAIKQLVGVHFTRPQDGAPKPVPINMIELAYQVISRSLVAKDPSVLVTTKSKALRATAKELQEALLYLITEINLRQTIQFGVGEGIFGLCIAKTGINLSAEDVDGYAHNGGQPFCDIVDLDDFVIDMSAKRQDKITFIGNRQREPLDTVKSCGLYDLKVVEEMSGARRTPLNENGDMKADSITAGQYTYREEYLEFVEFYELWLPLENKLLTLGCDENGVPQQNFVMRCVDYTGPETGPYHILRFTDVPGNLLPLPPVATWMDLHEIINLDYRKLAFQAERQKTLGFAMGEDFDVEKIRDAKDGEIFRGRPNDVEEKNFGGVNQGNFAFALDAMQRFSYQTGNLDSMGGLSAQAETLGQEELLAGNSNKRLADMSDRIEQWVVAILKDLAYYLFYTPDIQFPITKRIPGTQIEIESYFSSETREGDFLDYNFSIQPYSMQHQTPNMKAQQILNLLQNVIIPLGPVLEQQGMTLNAPELINQLADLLNLPELRDIIVSEVPLQEEREPIGEPPKKTSKWDSVRATRPDGQQKDYVRKSVGAGRAGQVGSMIQAALGGRQQPAEAARMTG